MSIEADTAADLGAVRARYAVERERRAQTGDRSYRDPADGFGHILADPFGEVTARDPVDDEVDVLVVGGGFGGLLVAARMREAGARKVRVIESASDFGGTWYWNRYPGAACDVESYIYFPLLEETGYMPIERYSKAAEIRAHCRRIAEHFGLYEDALFSTQVTALDWDAAGAHWVVRTNRSDRVRARFVVIATGPLNRPKLPAIAGIESFRGHSFHTSRWDYAYTGGTATEPMTGLADKVVAIIGTGATAIQAVPPLARDAKHLYVFQRTPSSVDARDNSPTDPAWAASLTPGWQQRRMESFTAQLAGELSIPDEVADGWTVLARAIRAKLAAGAAPDPVKLLEEADFEKMVQVRDRIGSIVHDAATAEALKPWFSLYCKRPCFHDEYLQTFNRANVTLVDTAGRGVERITERGLVVDGREYPVDCLIYATGFDTAGDLAHRSGFTVHGVGGQSLSDKWSGGLATLHGMHAHGYPNLFVISQAQSGMSPNFPHMLSEQATHAAHIVREAMARGIRTVEADPEAERAWVQTILDQGAGRAKFLEGCTPGYYNNEGKVSEGLARSFPYGAGPIAFINLMREWRTKGDMAGLEVDGAHALAKEAVAT
jgi:cyclohexanone monooxygenase